MQRFVNEPDCIVQQALDGLIWSSSDTICRLDGYPDIKVVVRKDWKPEQEGVKQVALISGGGSGHEPSHSGWVGSGMLTASVAGEIFASPNVDAILAAIVSVTGPSGCLLIVKNYTGDRINFGLAAEKARAQFGLRVEMCIIGDDIALLDATGKNRSKARGIAGTVLCHKIAGALAESGAPLEEVRDSVERVAQSTFTIGAALSSCEIPGKPDQQNRIQVGHFEVGLGIHGEPGAQTRPFKDADDAVTTLVQYISHRIEEDVPKRGIALLLNNLGSVPPMEMSILADCIRKSSIGSYVKVLMGPGSLMTSLQMNGFSISCLVLDDAGIWARCLLQPVAVRAWIFPVENPNPPEVIPLPSLELHAKFLSSKNDMVEGALRAITEGLIEEEHSLNELDRRVGDGDCGSTLATGARRLNMCLGDLPMNHAGDLLISIGQVLSKAMGGTSGVLVSLFLITAGGSMNRTESSWSNCSAFEEGISVVKRYGGSDEGHRTMLDALIPAFCALPQGISAAADAAEVGAVSTAFMKNADGRTQYVPEEKRSGIEDPGARAVAIVFHILDHYLHTLP